jgi:hypothetical protein
MDTMRKTVTLTVRLCEGQRVPAWRQHVHIFNKIKSHARAAQNKKKRSKAKTPEPVKKNQRALIQAHQVKKRFPGLAVCSFNKDFHSKDSQVALKEQLERVVLPRRGKLSRQAKKIETAPEFDRARRAHSAVESATNALEMHGLDVCLDHGIESFML